MKHGIIGDNITAFAGGSIGSFFVFLKPVLLNATIGSGEGILLTAAIWVLKLIGLSVISLATGFATALGADIFKNFKTYTRFKKNKDGKDQTSETDKSKAA